MSNLLRITRAASAEGTCQLIGGQAAGQVLLDATYARFGRSAPAFALKALFGESAAELLTSKRVLPSGAQESRFKQEFGGLDRALADLLA